MAAIPRKVIDVVKAYIEKVGQSITIDKAVLFGSYAKGTYDEGSDVDVAIFSDYFAEKSRVEGITYLLMQAMEFDLDLEPVAFSNNEYIEKLGIVEEIIRTGIDIRNLE